MKPSKLFVTLKKGLTHPTKAVLSPMKQEQDRLTFYIGANDRQGIKYLKDHLEGPVVSQIDLVPYNEGSVEVVCTDNMFLINVYHRRRHLVGSYKLTREAWVVMNSETQASDLYQDA